MPDLHFHSSFEKYMLQDIATFHGKFFNYIATSSFISCCFLSASTSADIIFYNFSEVDLKLSKKKFHHKFSFFRLRSQNSLVQVISRGF